MFDRSSFYAPIPADDGDDPALHVGVVEDVDQPPHGRQVDQRHKLQRLNKKICI